MNTTNNRIALTVMSIVTLILLIYWKIPKPNIADSKSKETEVSHTASSQLLINDHTSQAMTNAQQDECRTPRHSHPKMVEPMDSTFKPTPSTCPYHE